MWSPTCRDASARRARWHDEHVVQPTQPNPDLVNALAHARTVAEDHMIRADHAGNSWREETISELLWLHAQPFVMCADFTRHEESMVGADWLWWWVDDSGECFGMLVQAKRLHHRDGRPELNFRHNDGQQMKRLFRAAELFKVPATYALYFGGIEFRDGLTCGDDEHTSACERCRRASVSVITALQAELASLGSLRDAATLAFSTSVPLEDFVHPDPAAGVVRDLNLRLVEPGLREFLVQEQTGVRQVARELFRVISADRMMQFSMDVAEHVDTAADTVFLDLPLDTGHFSTPYFPHILRGLRTRPPAYVQDVLTGQRPPPAVTEKVGGIVVVRC